MSYDFGTTTVQEDYSRVAPPRRRRWVGLLATLLLMGVFVGGLWLAYTRGLHKGAATADGGAPLFRADPGLVKVKPDQPGGMPVPNQDKLVYNPDRTDAGVERLLPPPEQPMAKPVAPPPVAAVPPPSAPPVVAAPVATAPAGTVSGKLAVTSPALAPAAPAQPAVGGAPATISGLVAPGAPAISAAPGTAGTAAPKTAAAKPGDPKQAPAQVASLPPGSSTLVPPAPPKSILGLLQAVTGTRVQLGAVKTEEEAKQEAERLRRASGELLAGASVQISRADLGDRGVFYRIQTSPVPDAVKLCDTLKSRKIACTVVR